MKSYNKCLLLLISAVFTTNLYAKDMALSGPRDTQKKIKALCSERVKTLNDFGQFTDKLQDLGVVRQTYDVIQDEVTFYSPNTTLAHFPVSEVDKTKRNPFKIANSLDVDKLQKAIKDVDHKRISVAQFHEELAHAGVVYVTVYLKPKTIYYFGQDGKYFLEKY